MEELFLGIDLGTSAMKLVLMDRKKTIRAQITEEYEAAQPRCGWSAIDPELWYECMERGLGRILDHGAGRR